MNMRQVLILVVALTAAGCGIHRAAAGGDQPTPLNTPAPQTLIVVGTVTNAGVECPAVRGEDGKTYTIATPTPEKLKANARVRIVGSVAEMSTCMEGATIKATSIENLSGTVHDPTAVIAPTSATHR